MKNGYPLGSKGVRLNIRRLEPKKGKDYAEVLFFGDLHLGHPNCLVEKAQENIDYCLKNKIYMLIMGDLVECGLKDSVGDSVYMQKLNPQEQMDAVIEMLKPLADKGLILGLHCGNHEGRILQRTSLDVGKIIATSLAVPYLGYACWNLFKVGKQNYKVYSTHGSSGSRYPHTKLRAAIEQNFYRNADIIAFAHVHDMIIHSIAKEDIDLRNKTVKTEKKHVIITGHYLSYSQSYAEMRGYPPSKTGSPKAKLYTNKKSIHCSV